MVADPEWQFSAALNKPTFAGAISGRLFVSGRQKHKWPPQSLILYFHLKSDYAVELISWLPNSWRRHKNSTKFQISFCLPLFNSHLFAEKPTSHPSIYKTNTDYKQNQILDFKQAYVFCFSQIDLWQRSGLTKPVRAPWVQRLPCGRQPSVATVPRYQCICKSGAHQRRPPGFPASHPAISTKPQGSHIDTKSFPGPNAGYVILIILWVAANPMAIFSCEFIIFIIRLM